MVKKIKIVKKRKINKRVKRGEEEELSREKSP